MLSRCLRIAALAIATLALSGCYVLQAAGGQAEVIRRSDPIPDVLADPSTPAKTKERLQLVEAARAFAISELALHDGSSYKKYADMGRPYVVHNVVATPEFSVEPRRWCFPVAGCIAYRGYFDERDARAYGRKLSLRGDDVSVDGVPAYSTLGRLPDPVFGSMLAWRDARLVGTIFHELAHERVYFAGDSEVNEAFASVVEDEGIRRWLQQQGRDGEIDAHGAAMARRKDFAALLRDARSRLAELYASDLPSDAMRVEKQREFGRLKYGYERLRARWGGYSAYDGWFARVLNNAHLGAVATYEDCVPGLRRALQEAGSLPAFYEKVAATRRLDVQARHAELCGATPVPR
jgi:predicted aminopeptidase